MVKNKKLLLGIGVLAIGGYLFWRYKGNKKANFSEIDDISLYKSKYKQVPVEDELYLFNLPQMGKPMVVENKEKDPRKLERLVINTTL